MELLSPAGSFEGLIGAINAGADAVYIGGNKFGARAYAQNFSDDEIIRAISYAHKFNVSIYLTVNTLIKQKEFDKCIEYIRPFYEAGLDAVIVQDLGLMQAIRNEFPMLSLHISTQAVSTGINSVAMYKEMGCTRVVLARELTLDEIKDIKNNINVELETFIHGAMCYSYSGDCLMSSTLGGRSGNRGRCAGPCRLEYSYLESGRKLAGGYLMSMKDQCTLSLLPKLIEAGIDSFKIEGRMKKPEYSAFVTSIYRKYIDLITQKGSTKIDSKDFDNLRNMYLRKSIQTGYYECPNSKDMISVDSPSYNGSDDKLMDYVRKTYLETPGKLSVNAAFYAKSNEEISFTIYNDDHSITLYGPVAQVATNKPTSKDDIRKQLNKLGNTDYVFDNLEVCADDNLFIPIKEINEIRRLAISEFDRFYCRPLSVINNKNLGYNEMHSQPVQTKVCSNIRNIAFVETLEQFESANKFAYIDSIAIDSSLFGNEAAKINGKSIFVNLPLIQRAGNTDKIDEIIRLSRLCKVKGFIVNCPETFAYVQNLSDEFCLISGPSLYTFNRMATEFLHKTFSASIVSYELSEKEICDIADDNMILPVYGKTPLMVTKNCLRRTSKGCKSANNFYGLLNDRTNTDFYVKTVCDYCYNVIYNSVPTSLHKEVYKGGTNIRRYAYFFTTETGTEVNSILKFFSQIGKDKNALPPYNKYTTNYYKNGVE